MRINPWIIFLSLYLCFDLMPSVFNTHNYVSSSLCACGSALYSVLHDLVFVDYAVTQCRWLDGSGIVKVSALLISSLSPKLILLNSLDFDTDAVTTW